MKTIFKRCISAFIVLVITLSTVIGSLGVINAEAAKKLDDSVVKVKIFDTANGRDLFMKNGVYEMSTNRGYKFEVSFDLSKYNEQLNDGDYFTLTIPEPFTITNSNVYYLSDSGVQIGKVEPTSNGESKGGVVKVTLQNLDAYLKAKGGDAVRDVKGTFYIEFELKNDVPKQDIKFDEAEVKDPIVIPIEGKTPPPPVAPTEHVGRTSGENFAKNGGIIAKEDYTSEKLNKSGKYVHKWLLRINTLMKSYKELIIIDEIDQDGGAMQFIPESFKVSSGEFPNSLSSLEKAKVLVENVDYEIEFLDGFTKFRLKFLKPEVETAYRVEYKTTAPADGSVVGNIVSVMGDGVNLKQNEKRNAYSVKESRESKITDGGTITLTTGYKILIYKLDKDTGNPIKGVRFTVTTPENKDVELPLTDDMGRTISDAFPAALVAKGDFTIKETTPNGYKSIDPITVKVGEKGVIKTIKNERIKTSLEITKTWNDDNNSAGLRPDELTFTINSSDGKSIKKTVKEAEFTKINDNEWKYVVEGLPVYGENGDKLDYSVIEKNISKYNSAIGPVQEESNTKMTVAITNSYTPEKISISVTKNWVDDNDKAGLRPKNITVKVMNGTEVVREEEVRGTSNTWTHRFTDLPKYKNGQEINYTLEEVAVANYTADIADLVTIPAGDKTGVITNTHSEKLVNIEGTKTWEDNNDQDRKRPQNITVKLMNGDEVVEQKVVDATTNWTYRFENKPEYKNGAKINYTIDEEAVDGYRKVVEGFNLKNIRSPEKIKISGVKTWDDNNDQDKKRPQSITVKLMEGNRVVEAINVIGGDDTQWSYIFEAVDKYRDGQEIKYTVAEDAVDGYTTVIDGYNITNKYVPEVVTISGEKTWEDNDDQDRKRPDSINVNLMDGTKVVETVKVMAGQDGKWKYTFQPVAKFRDGQEINYTVKEDVVDGYTPEVNGYNIKNKYTPEVVTISGEKTWEDNNDLAKKRPQSITVNLMDGTKVVETVKVMAGQDGNWKYTFQPVAKFRAGQKINYTVEEVAVEGYTTLVNGFNITNKLKEVVVPSTPNVPDNNTPNVPNEKEPNDVPRDNIVEEIVEEDNTPKDELINNESKKTRKENVIPKTGVASTGGLLLAGISLMGIAYSIKKKED